MWPVLTPDVIRVVYSVYKDWVISPWVDMKDMDMRNWFATAWSVYFIIILKASRLSRMMKTASTVCATRCLIADINIVDVVEFYGRLRSLLYWKCFSGHLTMTLGSQNHFYSSRRNVRNGESLFSVLNRCLSKNSLVICIKLNSLTCCNISFYWRGTF